MTPPRGLFVLLLVILSHNSLAAPDIGSTTAASLNFKVTELTVDDIKKLIGNGTKSCKDIIQAHINRIDEYDKKLPLNSVIAKNPKALEEAAAKDKAGTVVDALLHCVPLLVKDNIDVAGMPTTNGALAFKEVIPSTDAECVKKLKAAGAIVIAKTNMAEMAAGGMDSKSAVGGQCRNPYGLDRTCYGSSGGTGAALAASLGVIGLGTDTEGSIVGPSHGGGLFGIREAVGWTSMAGVYPAFNKMDVVGPMARTVKDAITAWSVLKTTNINLNDYFKDDGMKGVRVGVLMNMFGKITISQVKLNYVADPATTGLIFNSLAEMQSKGAIVEVIQEDNPTTLMQIFGAIIGGSTAKKTCSRSCLAKEVDAYFGDSNRFPTKKPYQNAGELYNQTIVKNRLLPGYESNLNQSIINRRDNPGDVCNDTSATSCKPFIDAQGNLRTVASNLMEKYTTAPVDLFVVPTLNKPPIKIVDTSNWNASNGLNPDDIAAMFSPYTGWPSVDLPAGFSPPISGTNSTDRALAGLPVGMNILCKNTPAALKKMLQFAYAFQKHFPKRKVPPNTPTLYKEKAANSLQYTNYLLVSVLTVSTYTWFSH